MFLVHSPHLVGHQQLFNILTPSSSLGAGEMSCRIALWGGQRQSERRRKHRVTRADGSTDCFEIRSNLWIGLGGLVDPYAGNNAAKGNITKEKKKKEEEQGGTRGSFKALKKTLYSEKWVSFSKASKQRERKKS